MEYSAKEGGWISSETEMAVGFLYIRDVLIMFCGEIFVSPQGTIDKTLKYCQ